jgi:hypothetical protein
MRFVRAWYHWFLFTIPLLLAFASLYLSYSIFGAFLSGLGKDVLLSSAQLFLASFVLFILPLYGLLLFLGAVKAIDITDSTITIEFVMGAKIGLENVKEIYIRDSGWHLNSMVLVHGKGKRQIVSPETFLDHKGMFQALGKASKARITIDDGIPYDYS